MMTAGVRAGALWRWYEELCRIQMLQLAQAVTGPRQALARRRLPDQGGVYAFWWTGGLDRFRSTDFNGDLDLHGPGGRRVRIRIDEEWLGLETGLPIPLYVGKNANHMGKRIGQHLRLKEERMMPLGRQAAKRQRPTTSCQLRAGVEHMFPEEKDTRSLILTNVGLSFVVLDGDEQAANRFFLEDLAIGLMRPPLNIDIER